MEIYGPKIPPTATLTQLAKTQTVLESLRIGQPLQAVVVAPPQNGQATINVNGSLLTALTQFRPQAVIPLQVGQALNLEVTRLATEAVLKLVSQAGNVRAQASAPPVITLTLPSQAHQISHWNTARVLDATALSNTKSGGVLLELSGRIVEAKSSQPLPIQQPLKVEIINPGRVATLRIVGTVEKADLLGHAIRSVLPQQAPLRPVLNTLNSIAQASHTPVTQQPSLPPKVVELAQGILNSLPNTKNVASPEGLKQAFNQSGLFLEARLSRALSASPSDAAPVTANIKTDFKGGLLSLLVSLFTLTRTSPTTPFFSSVAQQAIPLPSQTFGSGQAQTADTSTPQFRLQQAMVELLRNVESGLSRIILNQLVSSAGEQEDGKRSWVLEIPVHHGTQIDVLQLRIDKDGQAQHDSATPNWSVNLAFDLQTLGPIQVAITLAKGVISTVFWSENSQTNTLINEHLSTLQQRLDEAGLTVGMINAHCGKAPSPMNEIPPLPQILLDVKA